MEVADKYLNPDRAKKKIVTLEENFEPVLKDSPFVNIETYNYDYDKTWSTEEIIGRIYSSPGKSRASFGDKASDFEKDLTDELLKIESSGKFVENLRVKALLAWKY